MAGVAALFASTASAMLGGCFPLVTGGSVALTPEQECELSSNELRTGGMIDAEQVRDGSVDCCETGSDGWTE